ncbi:hypothetical protein L8V23_02095 [Corynebacterium sp. c6VSa_13]|uniref:hypothetical protein n=1 Tax=Corynebacterium sp. c6VSa_13 TaxID=2913496 RepID=UPI00201132DC|nr:MULTISPECIES: hypothetical protein [Corynebacterium]MCZ9308556.1 hypothetical protein [Corynebacterium sp. c6VSa_13]
MRFQRASTAGGQLGQGGWGEGLDQGAEAELDEPPDVAAPAGGDVSIQVGDDVILKRLGLGEQGDHAFQDELVAVGEVAVDGGDSHLGAGRNFFHGYVVGGGGAK